MLELGFYGLSYSRESVSVVMSASRAVQTSFSFLLTKITDLTCSLFKKKHSPKKSIFNLNHLKILCLGLRKPS